MVWQKQVGSSAIAAGTIGREELTLEPTPPATETHRPIPHHEIVQALVETLGFRHIGIVHDEYAVSPDGTAEEMRALLDAPDPTEWKGVRDRALLHLCYAGGLRVSELIGIRPDDLRLLPQPSVLIHGKGRRERCLPLWKTTTSALRAWLAARGTVPVPELFVSARGASLTRSGFEYILRKHVRTAKQHCPSLTTKRVHPHVLRHTCALTVLQATKDLRKVALWLGHAKTQTTEMYTRVDPAVKLETLESVVPPKLRSGRFKATDKLIAWLEAATFMSTKKPTK